MLTGFLNRMDILSQVNKRKRNYIEVVIGYEIKHKEGEKERETMSCENKRMCILWLDTLRRNS